MNAPAKFEDEYPTVAEQLQLIANGVHPIIKRIDLKVGVHTFVFKDKTIKRFVLATPNDPCPCGRGKKYKKCCMNNQS